MKSDLCVIHISSHFGLAYSFHAVTIPLAMPSAASFLGHWEKIEKLNFKFKLNFHTQDK